MLSHIWFGVLLISCWKRKKYKKKNLKSTKKTSIEDVLEDTTIEKNYQEASSRIRYPVVNIGVTVVDMGVFDRWIYFEKIISVSARQQVAVSAPQNFVVVGPWEGLEIPQSFSTQPLHLTHFIRVPFSKSLEIWISNIQSHINSCTIDEFGF